MPVEVPKGENSAALADWVEVTLLCGSADALSQVRIARLLKGEASEVADEEFKAIASGDGDNLSTDEESDIDLSQLGDEAESERDVRVELLHEEMELRAKLGSDLYPFRIEDDRVVRANACGEDAYLLLLVLSSTEASFRAEKRANEAEAAFDHVALEAMRRYLGRNADGVRFSKPSSDPEDDSTRPKLFREAIKWLRERLDLRAGQRSPTNDPTEKPHWEFTDEAEERPILNTYKDGGVDLVIWWRFEDGRPGFPILLVQCTVQIAWERKLNDIPVEKWEKWIDFSMVPPQRALVIPFSEDPKDELWEDRTLDAGVVIDRVRLLELLNELDCDSLEGLVDQEIVEWTSKELATIA